MRTRTRILVGLLMTAALLPAFPAAGERPPFVFPEACCFLDGEVVRTVAPPAPIPQEGRDSIYAFPEGGAEGQKSVAAVGPGSEGYHGGQWAVYLVTWNVEPYLLTSDEAVLAAASAGDVSIVREPSLDNRCPIEP